VCTNVPLKYLIPASSTAFSSGPSIGAIRRFYCFYMVVNHFTDASKTQQKKPPQYMVW
jgi:hypothetical protein